jgi:subtilisin
MNMHTANFPLPPHVPGPRPRAFLRGLLALGIALLAAAPAQADVDEVFKRIQRDGDARVIVRMKADAGAASWSPTQPATRQRAAVAAALENVAPAMRNARVNAYRTFRTLPYLATTVNREQLLSLMTASEVDSVSLVRRERKLDNVSDLEKIQTTTAQASLDIVAAWIKGFDGTGYAVAVIDDGFNISHPMLAGKNVGDACFSSDFGTTTRNNCPSGTTPQIGVGAASNCVGDRCGHGTHVASIAVGNDGVNFGVARGAKLVPIDVFSTDSNPDDCSPDPAPCELTDSLAVLDALDYVNDRAAELKIAAVNLSLGGAARDGYCDDDPRKSVIDMLRQKGIAVAVAASNDGLTGKISAPACISSALGVGATNNGTTVASFSNFSSILDFMAPGVAIPGANSSGGGFVTRSGTSMSAPHVAGAWAVLRSAFPTGQFDQMETALKQTGIPVTRADTRINIPKIQVASAINRLQGKDRRIFNNLLSSSALGLGESFLRFFNDSTASGRVTVILRDVDTGAALGTWISPGIPARASPQFSIRTLETDAVAALGQVVASDTRPYYNLDITSTFQGYMQHVVWARGGGVFGNLSSCASGFATDASTLVNVHSSLNAFYPSRVRIVNTGATADYPVLSFYNVVTGALIATWTGPNIAPNASVDMTTLEFEQQNPALQIAVGAGVQQYNIKLSNLSGYLQHAVESRLVGALVDLSSKCDLGVAAASTSTSTSNTPSADGATASLFASERAE